jgi:methenyltetrahydrofolate cyclohydrolase
MALSDQPLVDLLAAFRSSDPTPGGGSASALGGAIGASLLAMVAGLSKPRTRTPEEDQQLAAARTRCATISDRLAALMDLDSAAYDGVVAQLAETVAAFGNTNAASDVQVGLELLGAGLRGAGMNVAINLTSLKDQAYVAAMKKEARLLEIEASRAHAAAIAALGERN